MLDCGEMELAEGRGEFGFVWWLGFTVVNDGDGCHEGQREERRTECVIRGCCDGELVINPCRSLCLNREGKGRSSQRQ